MNRLVQPVLTGTDMVRLTIALVAASARGAQELLDALRFLGIATRLEPGCLRCSAWTDPDLTVRYVEDWATEADVRRRVRSERFTLLLAVVESAKEPQVQFDFVTSTRGLDYVAQVRDTTPISDPPAPTAARVVRREDQ